jgi:hypothetical protein
LSIKLGAHDDARLDAAFKSKFDIKMGPDGELHLVNKDGSIVIPTGVFPE